MPLDGGAVTELAKQQPDVHTIASDGTSVFWTIESQHGAIRRVPVGGGTVVDVVVDQRWPKGLAVDGTRLWWTRVVDMPKHVGELVWMAKP